MGQKAIPPQKSLIVVFNMASVSGISLECSAAWYWSAEDAAAWLAPRRELFPDVSAQELVAMALLPGDVRESLRKPLCGLRPGSKLPTEDRLLADPTFRMLSDSCALCVIQGFTLSKGEIAERDAKKTLDIFQLRINRVWPGVMKEEFERLKKFSLVDLESSLRAAYEQKKLCELALGDTAHGLKSKRRAGI